MSFEVIAKSAVVSYPSSTANSYTASAIRKALKRHLPDFRLCDDVEDVQHDERKAAEKGRRIPALQVSDYDEIEWGGVKELEDLVMVNAYPIRKALIRKNALHTTTLLHTSKHPSCPLLSSIPQTISFELAFPDELDELFADDLYELGQALDDEKEAWWILKPAMAERGQGIRMFRSREELEAIFEEFEMNDDEDELSDGRDDTAVSTSQLRHWIVQRYISNPLLVDPSPATAHGGAPSSTLGRKHHLRVYVLAVGALEVYIFTEILALFAATPYSLPYSSASETADEEDAIIDLTAHLTNTCLQSSSASVPDLEANVHLLSDLVSCPLLPSPPSSTSAKVFTHEMQSLILDRIVEVTRETFKAGSEQSVHFQPLPNAFEIFGLDFIVDADLGVWLLEVNACPDFAQTGSRLSGVIDRLFDGAVQLAVNPFFAEDRTPTSRSAVGDERLGFRKCLDLDMRRGRR